MVSSSNNGINNTVGASISGVTNTLTVTNPSNTASSAARATVVVGGGTAGDPTVNWNVSGATNWEMGIDNSDSDKWKLSQGTALGTNDTIVAFTTGQVLKPQQPGFLAYLSTGVTNVTGDGTVYTLICDTEQFDTSSNYNNATGVFTAPVAGRYLFNINCNMSNIGVAHTSGTIDFLINATTSYHGNGGNAASQSGFGLLAWTGSLIISLAANDTVRATVRCSNGAKTVGVVGSDFAANTNPTYFSGYLLG